MKLIGLAAYWQTFLVPNPVDGRVKPGHNVQRWPGHDNLTPQDFSTIPCRKPESSLP
jgi:hypothetical protein